MIQTYFQWKSFLGKMLIVESKSVPSYFWATENSEGRDGRGILEMDGHVFRVCIRIYTY